ncbi:MAG: nitronate monooxygenase [Gammaproteobacteria bacterium]|jgi:nitronate monooxygenase|nr:nitronate monooxygenase [Gammaproteobacteria bacterium]MBT3721994.1 nitronate monooxygenase [Gammaproteobacteria bacterium]MBT4077786.1 nitronate monooxygenase [Gammaproteobacteria bacterium]MBT4196799.1 nitronate monooxygenase [Gammaproteobacteria bacterium]MBT4449118.1 nitronate monooxygenase [Gammaproteobacteria bacterium]
MNQFIQTSGVEFPIIGGPMYPCSNPELVAAMSEAGALGIVQPLSLTYVHGYDFLEGMQYIRSLTDKPVGFNALIEKSSRKYEQRMSNWIDIALDQGVLFFITSLGKPDWVVKRVHAYGGLVYHDVTERKWAEIGVDCGADGLICVNNRAGGHCGTLSAQQLFDDCQSLQKPMVSAGGISDHQGLSEMLEIGYQACQLGTRFIATEECKVSDSYKQAIVDASDKDITLTEKMTGVPVSIIKPASKDEQEFKAHGILAWMLKSRRFKHITRLFLSIKSIMNLKSVINPGADKSDYWQAGKSVAGINKVLTVKQIIQLLMNNPQN